ncbi:M3 family oligoendopeptidase [Pseudalkalibacillus sp. SCS-8]|uniref:M3 family oligoendopeptidase n=1 Tax=Pseudalkalibacillus nanhaiensis TaxID=3115291 RepID=UPI0032DA26C0
MTFSEYHYERPDMIKFKKAFLALLKKFEQASSKVEQNERMKEIVQLRTEFESMMTICSIRHSIDTTDSFYKQEKDFFDEQAPVYEGYVNQFYRKLLQSKHRFYLEEEWGSQLFRIAMLSLNTYSEEIMQEMKEENKLTTQYSKLIASAKIEFDGKQRTLAQLSPFIQSKNRKTRKRASEAKYHFYAEHEEEFDLLYDQLVKVRSRMAHNLGYSNFIQLGYDRLLRVDYGECEVQKFREQVLKHIVPISQRLFERQRRRIGTPTLTYYDLPFNFKSGNPTPKGDPEWIIRNGKRMYAELSAETNEFFQYMNDNELMDLVNKQGKRSGGYCTYISKYKSPFIFSNFVGTSHDIDVLTHEAGHAFQVYSSRHLTIPEYAFPTHEAAEIHSMSMEFFTWPWMRLFFEEEAPKYWFSHLSGALTFIPYAAAVDEFQHFVYQNPEISPAERKRAWRKIERKYLPHRDYEDNDFLERGCFWYQQGHIFRTPFYYIDYALAQICAMQFWCKAYDDWEHAWSEYLYLCRQGGRMSFTELLKGARLNSPFEEDCVQSVVAPIVEWLEEIDDAAL